MRTSSAFDLFVNEHARTVRRVCRAILRDEHLGDDAAQDAFLRLWRRWRDRGCPEAPEGWIRCAAVSAALDLSRRRDVRDRTTHAVLADATADDVATRHAPEREAADHELRARYRASLDRLPEGQRTIFVLRHEAGLPLGDIAESLGVAVPTVRTQFARACVRLQSMLNEFREPAPAHEIKEETR